MKSMFVLSLLLFGVNIWRLNGQVDTVFAKGGTCLYKIFKEYDVCLKAQQERLDRESDSSPRMITLAEQRTSLNQIGCCAYWEFLSCVEKAADEKCIKDRTDMEKYTEQLGSSVPLYICREEYPRGSDVCGSSHQIVISSLLFIISFIIMFLK